MRQSALTKRLIEDGIRRNRVPFDFNRRMAVARAYLDDGALHTCAERLESLAEEIRAAAVQRDADIRSGGRAA